MSFENYEGIIQEVMNSEDKKAMYDLACDLQKSAAELFKKSAESRLIKAMYKLGICYETGCGTELNYDMAIHYYKAASECADDEVNSDDEAGKQALIDELMGDNDNDMSDYSVEELIKCATVDHNPQAQYELGLLYQFGDNGMERDTLKSRKWYLKAARQGHESAVLSLAENYEENHLTAEAAKWYRKYTEIRMEWHDKYLKD